MRGLRSAALCAILLLMLGGIAQAQDTTLVVKADSSSTEAVMAASQIQLQLIPRRAEERTGLEVFLGGDYEKFKANATALEDDFKSNTRGVGVLIDYGFSRTFQAGLGVRFGKLESDNAIPILSGCAPGFRIVCNIRPSLTPTHLDVRLWTLNGYGVWNPVPALTVAGSVGYGKQNYKSTRDELILGGSTTPALFLHEHKADYDGHTLTGSVGATYDIQIDSLTLTPLAKIQSSRSRIDAYEESGEDVNVIMDSQEIKHLNTTVGLQVRYAISTNVGVFVPQIGFTWVHEFEDDQRFVLVRFREVPIIRLIATNPPDRDYFRISPTVVMQFPRGFSGFIGGEALIGYRDRKTYDVSAGIRYEF